MTEPKDNTNKSFNAISEEEFKKIFELIKGVGFGSITLVIQDGKVVQIEKNVKVRLA